MDVMVKRRTRWLLILIGVMFVLSVLTLWLFSRLMADEPPPNDEDLRISLLDIPDEENGFYYFEQAAEKVYWPEDKEDVLLAMLKGEEELDAELVQEVLAKNREAFELLEQGLGCSRYVIRQMPQMIDEYPYLQGWRYIAYLMCLRCLLLFEGGQEKEAFDQALAIVRFGHMMEGSRGTLVHYLVGLAIKTLAAEQFIMIVHDSSLAAQDLSPYIKRLAPYTPDREALADVLKIEYMLSTRVLQDVCEGKMPPEFWREIGREVPPKLGTSYALYQPNRSRRIFADAFRILIANAPSTFGLPNNWKKT